MKYMTKQWYQTMQDSCLGVCLQADDRAAEYSEALFQEVWAEKLADWLKLRREVAELTKEPFAKTAEIALFEQNYTMLLNKFQTRTPQEILKKTADVRLLALDRCTGKVLEAFETFREGCEKQTDRTAREYRGVYRAQGLDAPWAEEFGFHDEQVISWCENGDDWILDFGPAAERYCPVEKVIFRNARILRQDRPIDGAWWLYEEVYRVENGYEIHVLLDKEGLIELTLWCADVALVPQA